MIKTRPFTPSKFESIRIIFEILFKKLILWYILILCFFLFIGTPSPDGFDFYLYILEPIAVIAGYIILLAVYYWFVYSSSKNKLLLMERIYEVDDNLFTVKYADGSHCSYQLSNLSKIVRTKKYMLYYFTKSAFFYIPNRMIENVENADNHLHADSIMNDCTNPATAVYQSIGSQKLPIFLYFVSVLFLIPVAGVFLSIIFIILGFTSYKSRILIFFGSVGILANLVYFILFVYYVEQNSPVIRMMKKMNHSEQDWALVKLVKESELFKIRTGKYPNSLEDLKKEEIDITDKSLFSNDTNPQINYYYQSMDSCYTLFSVGKDKKPFTNDDVYPELNDAERAKYGFRK